MVQVFHLKRGLWTRRPQFCHCAKFKQNLGRKYSELGLWPKKAQNSGKNSPKIQGGPQHGQLRNLSSPMDPASHGAKISPSPLLRAEKLGVKFSNLTKNFWKRGAPPPPNFYAVGKASASSISPASLLFLVREIRKCRRRRWRAR